jgi:HSP20 family protein
MATSVSWAKPTDETAQLKMQVAQLQGQVKELQDELGKTKQQQAQQSSGTPSYRSVQEWDPFRDMALMQEHMQNLMQAHLTQPEVFDAKSDIQQTDKSYIVTIDLPGMEKDKINVQLEEGMLVVSGERSSETKEEDKGNQFYRQQRSFGHFMQAIPLPEDAKAESIDAQYNNGVLTVTIAREKKAEKKPESKKITVK